MNYSAIKNYDIANGPGVRVSLYVSGCRRRCKGCFNPETWDFGYGHLFDETVEYEIMEALAPSYIKGFSLLGGEPFEPENQRVLLPFLKRVKQEYPHKTIWCYTGYLLDEQLWKTSPARCEVTDEMLLFLDVLVDGEFVQEEKDLSLRFCGSRNQRLIDVKESLRQGRVCIAKV